MDKTIMRDLSMVENNRSVIPESCLTFSEMADYISKYALDETIKFASLTESADDKTVKAAFRDHLDKIWAVDKAYFEKALKEFKVKAEKAKQIKLTAAQLNTIEDDKVYGKYHRCKDDINFANNAIKFARKVNSQFTAVTVEDDVKSSKEVRKSLERELCSAICGDASVGSTKQLRRVVNKKLLGSAYKANGSFVKRHLTEMNSVLNDATLSTIKKSYNSEKQLIAALKSSINRVDSDVTSIANAWASVLVSILTVTHKCYAVKLDVASRQFSEALVILGKISKDVKKDVKESEAPEVTDADDIVQESDEKLVVDPGTNTQPDMKGSLDEPDDKKAESALKAPVDKSTDITPEENPNPNKKDADGSIGESTEVIEEAVKLPEDMKITDEDFWNGAKFKEKFKKQIEFLISNGAKDKQLSQVCYNAYYGNLGCYFVNTDYSKKYAPKLVFLADYVNKYPKYKGKIVKDLTATLKSEGKVSKRVPENERQSFLAYQKAYMVDAKAMLSKLQ